MAGAVLIAWWARTISLMRMCTLSGPTRMAIFAIYLPVASLLLLTLCWGLVAAVVLISLIILSLT